MIKVTIFILLLKVALAHLTAIGGGTVYSVWAEPNLHLMMCDNGTPDNYDDDWVVDWEDNREVTVTIHD